MPPLSIPGASEDVYLKPPPLTQSAFSQFGTVISNPAPSLTPSSSLASKDLQPNAVIANQGSALKYIDVSTMVDLYAQAPSKVPSKTVMHMFVCAPRSLISGSREGEGIFPVEILERHPYTSQTFIPLGLSPSSSADTQYLIIVAPSLPPSSLDLKFPVPTGDSLPGRGLPDLKNMRAFIAHGGMAVTYAAGTWHAPMVVLGSKPIDFVVTQSANGVDGEDCQEVVWGKEGEGAIGVVVGGGEARMLCML